MNLKACAEYLYRVATEVNPRAALFMGLRELVTPVLSIRTIETVDGRTISAPNSIYINITHYCEDHCRGCYVTERSNRRVMPEKMIDAIFRDGKALGATYYTFLGGEPFSPSASRVLLDAAEKHNSERIVVCTNGKYIDDEIADRVASIPNFSPLFSIDGFQEQNDYRRGNGAFDITTRAIKKCKDRKALFGAMGTVTKDNSHELSCKDFLEFLINSGVRYIVYSPLCGKDIPSPEQYAEFVDRINKLAPNAPITIFINHFGKIAGDGVLDLETQRLKGAIIDTNGIVSCERFGGNLGRLEAPFYAFYELVLSEGFQKAFNDKFDPMNWDEVGRTRDARYTLLADTVSILEQRGYTIIR